FDTLPEAVKAHTQFKRPLKFIRTSLPNLPKFPSYSSCDRSFFRVATINKNIDEIISNEGWKSGRLRKMDEIQKNGNHVDSTNFTALPPSSPIEDRIVEYVRVKD